MPPFPYEDEHLFDERARDAPTALDDESVRDESLVPNWLYRTDTGDRWYADASDRPGGDGDRLQAWGYL